MRPLRPSEERLPVRLVADHVLVGNRPEQEHRYEPNQGRWDENSQLLLLVRDQVA